MTRRQKQKPKSNAAADKLAQQKSNEHPLAVTATTTSASHFNTIKPLKDDPDTGRHRRERHRLCRLAHPFKAIAGHRCRRHTIKKGTYLYALINGFSAQRVTLEVRSIFCDGKILPVKLDLYDTDGLPGLYVPESAFRDFTKDLGTNTIQGVTMDGSSSFVMSSIGKIFESTSSAIAGMIRKNKAQTQIQQLYLPHRQLQTIKT
jgi:hypothetical protein